MNFDEYADLVSQVIASNSATDGGSLTVAKLGMLLRRAKPDLTWKDFGHATLSRFLRQLEDQGRLRLGQDQKAALIVIAIEGPRAVSTATAGARPQRYNPLRKAFWVAFVLDQPHGRRFFHKASGELRMGLTEAPSPADEWVEVKPISPDTQRGWAREFQQLNDLTNRSDTLAPAMSRPDWFVTYPQQLDRLDPMLGKSWNRYRTQRVSEVVGEWCIANGVPLDAAFQSPKPVPRAFDAVVGSGDALSTGEASLRSLLLGAISKLPTEALLEIPVPAKYLLGSQQLASVRRK